MMKFCRYYKGEDENPYSFRDKPKYAVAFWRLDVTSKFKTVKFS